MKTLSTRTCGALCAAMITTLGACAAPTEGDAAQAADEIVGITDIAALEAALDLRATTAQAPGSETALKGGDCYKALIATGTGYPGFEFRRYQNGAAFFSQKGSGANSGDARPILCVDFHQDNLPLYSLGGVSLDAVLRLDLGKKQSVAENSATGDSVWQFERGTMSFRGMPEGRRFDSARKRPHELRFDDAPSITGSLEKIKLKAVKVSSLYLERPELRDQEMRGELAFLLYRYAWRKAENSGNFKISTDAVGVFTHEAEIMGDGGGYAETWRFSRGNGGYGSSYDMGDDVDPKLHETLSFWRGEIDWRNGRVPLAECNRDAPQEGAPPPYACTGL